MSKYSTDQYLELTPGTRKKSYQNQEHCSRATPSLELGTSKRILWFCCCMLAITFSTEFTLSGAAAMAKQEVTPAVLWIRRFSGGIVTFMPENMNVMVGGTMGTE
jgi:hypothetical protein